LDTNSWINKNYPLLLSTINNIVSNKQDVDDLFHCVLEQMLKKRDKVDEIPDENKLYYFIRVTKNNYFSKTSPYYYEYKKKSSNEKEFMEDLFSELADEEYVDRPSLEWVEQQLQDLDWFSKDLFLLWISLGSLTNVSQQTKIPLNSVGRYIKETKKILIEKWQNRDWTMNE